MSEPELAHVISNDLRRGVSKPYIAERFDCALSTITDVETLANLHDKVMKCFNDCSITLNQAAAFATIPNKKAQWDLLLQLGSTRNGRGTHASPRRLTADQSKISTLPKPISLICHF